MSKLTSYQSLRHTAAKSDAETCHNTPRSLYQLKWGKTRKLRTALISVTDVSLRCEFQTFDSCWLMDVGDWGSRWSRSFSLPMVSSWIMFAGGIMLITVKQHQSVGLVWAPAALYMLRWAGSSKLSDALSTISHSSIDFPSVCTLHSGDAVRSRWTHFISVSIVQQNWLSDCGSANQSPL